MAGKLGSPGGRLGSEVGRLGSAGSPAGGLEVPPGGCCSTSSRGCRVFVLTPLCACRTGFLGSVTRCLMLRVQGLSIDSAVDKCYMDVY